MRALEVLQVPLVTLLVRDMRVKTCSTNLRENLRARLVRLLARDLKKLLIAYLWLISWAWSKAFNCISRVNIVTSGTRNMSKDCSKIQLLQPIENSRALQTTDTVSYWWSAKSVRIFRVPHGQIFQKTDTLRHSTFSIVKSLRRLNSFLTVSYISTGLNT